MTAPQHIRRGLLLYLALLLTACGVGPTPTPTVSTQPAPQSRTRLVLWHAWPAGDQRALNTLVERFNRSSQQAQIVLQTRPAASLPADLAAATAEGGGPHMVLLRSHTIGALAENGWLQPIDDLLPAAEQERLLPAAIGAAQIRDGTQSRLYGVPVTFNTLGLYYNTAYFVAQPPTDTAALLSTARGFIDDRSDPQFWGLAYNLSLDRTIGYLYAFGGSIFDESGELILGLEGREGAEAWLRWLVELDQDEALLASRDGITVDSALLAGSAAMTIDWSYNLSSYRALWPDSLGVAPLPRLASEDSAPQPYVQADVLALNARIADPTERSAAAAFMRYMISAEAQAELLRAARQPVLLSLDLDDEALADPPLRAAARAFRAQGELGQPMPNSRLANEVVWSVIADMQAGALSGLLSPEQAVDGADATLRERLGLSGSTTP